MNRDKYRDGRWKECLRSVNRNNRLCLRDFGTLRSNQKPIESPNKSRPRDTKMRLLRGIFPNAAWTTRLWWTRLALLWSKMSRPNMQHHFPGCAILPGSINPYPTAWAYWSLNKGCNLVIIILNWPMPNSTYPHMLSQYVTNPSRLYPLTAAGLTLNHNKRADWNLCHVSCTIKVAMAPHAGGPWEAVVGCLVCWTVERSKMNQP